MSVALATKGIISGFGGGGGEGGLYPDGYIASAINVAIDLEDETTVEITQPSLSVIVSLSENISVAIDDDQVGVSISIDDDSLGVTV